jgi:hypothetical protein
MGQNYSRKTAKAIQKFLNNDGWNYQFHEDTGRFEFTLELLSDIKRAFYTICVLNDNYTVYATADIAAATVDANGKDRLAEFLHRANYGLPIGNFEFGCDDGNVRYAVNVLFEDTVPTWAIIQRSILCPGAEISRYAKGILQMINEPDVSPEDAVRACEEKAET